MHNSYTVSEGIASEAIRVLVNASEYPPEGISAKFLIRCVQDANHVDPTSVRAALWNLMESQEIVLTPDRRIISARRALEGGEDE